jgi:hypothetical protein
MNAQQAAEVQTALRVQGFCEEVKPQFSTAPPKPGDEKFKTTTAALRAINDELAGKHAVQTSGGFAEASTEQASERQGLFYLISLVNQTVAAIAADRATPSLMDRFRMPHGNNDEELAAKGNAFANAITSLDLVNEIHSHGYAGDIVADLNEAADALRSSESDQGNALGDQVGATAKLPTLLRQARIQRKTLNAIILNRFRSDSEMQGRWASANHVAAPRNKSKPPATPPQPQANPSPQ